MVSYLKWLTYLSLDAPLVTVAWQALLARRFASNQSWYHYAIIFMSVWLGYAADRWFDNRKRTRPKSEQHIFLALHSKKALLVWVIVLATAVTLSYLNLDHSEFTHGLALAAASLAYTAFAQKGRRLTAYPLLKSLFTALLVLASSTLFLPSDSIDTLASRVAVVAIWLLFACNCLFIRSWTRKKELGSSDVASLVALLAFSLSVFSFWKQEQAISIAVLTGLCGILALHNMRERVPTPIRRTLADLCLLSPILVLFA